MTTRHDENFPVGSHWIPAFIRPAIHAIYDFAREADDIADEGNDPPHVRLAKLNALKKSIETGERLHDVITTYQLPKTLFFKLLQAFEWDVAHSAGQRPILNRPSLFTYCDHSANPIGELLLRLCQVPLTYTLPEANALCTALQLLNFWQDIYSDLNDRQRIYLPRDELRAAGIPPTKLLASRFRKCGMALLTSHIDLAQRLLQKSRPLRKKVPWRLALEIRAIQTGGWVIAEKLKMRGDHWEKRPKIQRKDRLMLAHTFFWKV